MKRVCLLLVFCVVLVRMGLADAQEGPISSYYTQVDFLSTSPSSEAGAIGAYVNPATVGMLPGFELEYFWSDQDAKFKSIKRWGLFSGIPHLGFGVVHQKLPSSQSVTDYRLGVAFGDRGNSFGLGYGWSTGDVTQRPGDIFIVGSCFRPCRVASLGLVGNFATKHSHRSGVVDLGIRPLGNSLITLFADAEMHKQDKLEDARWGVGLALEPIRGFQVVGKYLDNKFFSLGLNFSLGKKVFSSVAHLDDKQKVSYTTYGLRTGYPIDNIFDRYLKKNKSYLSLNLKGNVAYQKYRFFDDETHTLSGILFSLEDAIQDPRVAGVALNLSGIEFSGEFAWEIHQKLIEVKEAGKKVVIFIDGAGMPEYHLASVADRIVMDPMGLIALPGYVAGRTYYRNMLEKMGVGFDEWRFFTYKSANESFSREKMSEPDREQRQELVDDFYALVRKDVASSRNISEERFDFWVNNKMIFLAKDALDSGLVDTLARWKDIDEVIKSLEGKNKGTIEAKRFVDEKFPSRTWGEKPKIVVVYALGVCAMDEGINARQLEGIFRQLEGDSRVKAVVFRVDSPGGDALASDVVAEALRKCAKKKPVIVSQGGVAASGGYWISMYGDTIVAAPNTVTGSIGVIGGMIYNQGIGSKLGLTSDYVKAGEHADFGFGITIPILGITVPDRKPTPEEGKCIEELIKMGYKEFVSKVANGRKLSEEKVDSIGQGRVWSGIDGKEKGLV
ncbi:MAG TPA: S49 family peptidase, partial [candidate division Zixibacteria bacterium]